MNQPINLNLLPEQYLPPKPTKGQMLLTAVVMAGLAVIIALLMQLYTRQVYEEALVRQKDFLDYASEFLRVQELQAEEVQLNHQQNLIEQIRIMEGIYERREENGTLPPQMEYDGAQVFQEASFSDFIFLVDGSGQVLLSSDPSCVGEDLAQLGVFSRQKLEELENGGFDRLAVLLNGSWQGQDLKACPGQWMGQDYDIYFVTHERPLSEEPLYLVFGEASQVLDEELNITRNLQVLDHQNKDGLTLTFLADLDEGTFLRFRNLDQNLDGQQIADYGIDPARMAEETQQTMTFNGRSYLLYARMSAAKSGNRVAVGYAIDPTMPIRRLATNGIGGALLILTIVAVLGLIYNFQLRNRYMPGSPKLVNPEVLRRTGAFFLCGLLAFAVFTTYGNTYGGIARAMEDADDAMEAVTVAYREIDESARAIESYYANQTESFARLVSLWAEETANHIFNPGTAEQKDFHVYTSPKEGEKRLTPILDQYGDPIFAQANHPLLARFAQKYSLNACYFMNSDGYTIASSDNHWHNIIDWENMEEDVLPFGEVLQGIRPYHYVENPGKDGADAYQIIAVPITYYVSRTEAGEKQYLSHTEYLMAQDAPTPGRSISWENGLCILYLDGESPATLHRNLWISNSLQGTGTATDDSLQLFEEGTEQELLESSGVPENMLGGEYNFFRKGGEFTAIRYNRDNRFHLVTTRDQRAVYRERSFLMGTAIEMVAFYLTLVTLLLSLNPKGPKLSSEEIFPPPPMPQRRPGIKPRWNELTPEEKLARTVTTAVLGVISIELALVLLQITGHRKSVMLSYLLSDRCARGFNIFSVSYCVMLMGIIFSTTWIMRASLERVSRVLNRQLETYVRLLSSVIQYALLIGGIMNCLYHLGMDTSGILTSATVLAAVVGFGAKNMVADIVMGTLIVFDGDFRVGDYVKVNNFTGIVRQIGQRNTKIVNVDGSVLTIANSNLSTLINLSDEMASVYVTLVFSRSFRPDQLQREIDMALTKKLNGCQYFLEIPYYLGIVEMTTDKYTIAITGRCLQSQKSHAERELNRVLVEIMSQWSDNPKGLERAKNDTP